MAVTNPSEIEKRAMGIRMRTRRQSLNLSRGVIASRLKVAEGTVAKWENGTNAISAVDLWRLAGVLRVPVSAFYGEEPMPKATDEDIEMASRESARDREIREAIKELEQRLLGGNRGGREQ